jgi:hypothetical protein
MEDQSEEALYLVQRIEEIEEITGAYCAGNSGFGVK